MSALCIRRCGWCRARMVSVHRTGIVLCEPCLSLEVTVEKVEAAIEQEIALVGRMSANATCTNPKCPCRRAFGNAPGGAR